MRSQFAKVFKRFIILHARDRQSNSENLNINREKK